MHATCSGIAEIDGARIVIIAVDGIVNAANSRITLACGTGIGSSARDVGVISAINRIASTEDTGVSVGNWNRNELTTL